MDQPAPARYDRFYYQSYGGIGGSREYRRDEHWLGFFGYIAERTVTDIGPRTALDAGCAMGFLVEALRDRGVEAFGVDISEYALEQVREDIRPYCTLGSVTEPFPHQSYDLIFCIETLEHLPALEAERAVANICSHTNDVIFSSTPIHYKEASHLNVQPPEYWAELFARHGLYRDHDYDPSSYISPWATRFRRSTDPPARIAAGYERLLWRLRSENRELRELVLEQRDQLAQAAAAREQLEAELKAERAEAQAVQTELDRSWAGKRLVSWMLPPGSRRRILASSVRSLVRARPPGRA